MGLSIVDNIKNNIIVALLLCSVGVLTACGGGSSSDGDGSGAGTGTGVENNGAGEDEVCTFTELPLLGQSVNTIQVSDIMNRVFVTHDWMGVRFEQILSQLSPEALSLFKPVATIFIGSEVPSTSYDAFFGSLRIDPEALWLTAAEKSALPGESPNTDNDDDEPTTSTRDDLQFRSFFSYTKNGIALDDKESADARVFSDIFDTVARRMYSQLAFAADFFPASAYTGDRPLASPKILFEENSDDRVITGALYDDVNLTAQLSELYDVARVYYQEQPANEFQQNLTAEDAAEIYNLEGKPRLRSYRSEVDDMRHLFVMGMLKYQHDISLAVNFVNGQETNSETLVAFGLRNRIAAPLVAPRAKFVMERLIGSSDSLDAFFQNDLGLVDPITPGTNYYDYLDEIFPPSEDEPQAGLAARVEPEAF